MTGPVEIPLADPGFGPDERAAVDRVMDSGWLSMGPETAALETELAAGLGSDGAVSVSNGTAALHLALLALGVGPGDEVVVPSLTFVASAAAALMVGARPVLVDIVGPHDPTVDPNAVRAALTPRTRAIVAVHYGGWSARLGALRAVADAAGAFLVEDAAHAPLVPAADVPGRSLGTVGDAGCFSFHATKNLASGEGGMVVARDPEVRDRVRTLRSHGMTAPSWDHRWGRAAAYDVPRLGFNYRPTDLTAAIARVQLARLPDEQAARAGLTAEYRRRLADLPVGLPFAAPGEGPSSYHLLPIVLPAGVDRPAVQAALRAAGIHSGVHYPPVHRFSAYRGMAHGRLDRTEAVADRLLSLPLHGRLTTADVGRVVDELATALDAASPDSSARSVSQAARREVGAAHGR
jgi:dTDP-4-amino-4,6-dideoxygalactose transaminase